jgi:hypothetical protein
MCWPTLGFGLALKPVAARSSIFKNLLAPCPVGTAAVLYEAIAVVIHSINCRRHAFASPPRAGLAARARRGSAAVARPGSQHPPRSAASSPGASAGPRRTVCTLAEHSYARRKKIRLG